MPLYNYIIIRYDLVMRVRVNFGLLDTKEVWWWQEITDFPKLIKFSGKNFEWVFYDKDKANVVDYILSFAELPPYDPNYNIECSTWAELFGERMGGCVCGSKYTSFSFDHMFYCSHWTKW